MDKTNSGHLSSARRLLEANNYFMRIEGSSMEPLLKAGDIVKVEPIKPEEIANGDLAIFVRGKDNTLVCHRIIYTSNKQETLSFLEKGDNSMVIGLIFNRQIIGRMKCIVNRTEIKKPAPDYNLTLLSLLHSFFLRYAGLKGFITNRIDIKEMSSLYCFYKASKKKAYFLLLKLFLREKNAHKK